MHLPDPVFPPLFSGHAVRAPRRPFAEAVEGARGGRFGAGDVIWARNTRLMDLAVVLEPDVKRPRTYEIVCLAAVALADAIGAVAPPEAAINWTWPDQLTLNNARFGEIRFAVSREEDGEEVPRWLVLGIEVAVAPAPDGPEPGLFLDRTTLVDEGCSDLTRTHVIEAWMRHFLVWLNTWSEDGFGPVHEAYLFRANGYRQAIEVETAGSRLSGIFQGLDDHGNMLLKTDAGTRLIAMSDRLGQAGQGGGR